MITITPRATNVIRRVTAHPKLAPTSGLRIATVVGSATAMDVRIVHRPDSDDRVVEQDGGRLYLAPAAAQRLADRELDAETGQDGRVHFISRPAA